LVPIKGDVIRGRAEIRESEAIVLRQQGIDVVVCGNDLVANRELAEGIEKAAQGGAHEILFSDGRSVKLTFDACSTHEIHPLGTTTRLQALAHARAPADHGTVGAPTHQFASKAFTTVLKAVKISAKRRKTAGPSRVPQERTATHTPSGKLAHTTSRAKKSSTKPT
jgi:hypothetical protein